ncbi:MAG: hypothetical protein WC707_01545 [Candidatus Babeliaceae bacterium]|jgi:hypothetical protein
MKLRIMLLSLFLIHSVGAQDSSQDTGLAAKKLGTFAKSAFACSTLSVISSFWASKTHQNAIKSTKLRYISRLSSIGTIVYSVKAATAFYWLPAPKEDLGRFFAAISSSKKINK